MRKLYNILYKVIVVPCCKLWSLLRLIRTIFANVLLISIGLCMVKGGWNCYKEQQRILGDTPRVLVLNLLGTIHETPPPHERSYGWFASKLRPYKVNDSLFGIVAALRQAATDKNIAGAVLQLDNFSGASHSTLYYIRKALLEFRSSGKPLYAIGDQYTQSQYYLASCANQILLSPHGGVFLRGLSAHFHYYHSLLKSLQITPYVFRVGKYKSAVEPLLRDDMSPEAHTEIRQHLTTIWQSYLEDISQNRNLSLETLCPESSRYIEQLTTLRGDEAQFALQRGLIDQLADRNTMRAILIKIFNTQDKNKELRTISLHEYTLAKQKSSESHIAVIIANGPILHSRSAADFEDESHAHINYMHIAKLVRQARLDKRVKAVVLRVNSPGGSATASELIRQELKALKATGKPIVVSMGSMAASGGYWISTPADTIIASETTMTGSIGIFSVLKNYENGLKKIGISTDGETTSPLNDLTPFKPLSPQLEQLMQLYMHDGYNKFIQIVAEARKKQPEQIEALAQGRVWLGKEAHQQGLVDKLGDFDDAIAKAAELAQLKKYQLRWLTAAPSGWLNTIRLLSHAEEISYKKLLQQLLLPLCGRSSGMHFPLQLLLNDPKDQYALCLQNELR